MHLAENCAMLFYLWDANIIQGGPKK